MSDPQPGRDQPSAPENVALPTDWADDASEVPTPEDTGSVIIGPDWFAPGWADKPEVGPADDASEVPTPQNTGSVIIGPDWFAPGWANKPEVGPADDFPLAPAPVDEPEPLSLAVLPGPRPEAASGPGRWDRWRPPRLGSRAAEAAVVGLVLGTLVLVLSRSDRPPTDLVQSRPTTVLSAPPLSVATTQVPILPASPVDITAPATDAPETDAVSRPVQAAAGSNPPPAAGALGRSSGAPPPASPSGGTRPASGPSPGPGPAPASAPAAAPAGPAPATADPGPRQEQPDPTVSRPASHTTLPQVTATAPPPETTVPPAQEELPPFTATTPPPQTTVPPAEEDQLPCFVEIQHGPLACP